MNTLSQLQTIRRRIEGYMEFLLAMSDQAASTLEPGIAPNVDNCLKLGGGHNY